MSKLKSDIIKIIYKEKYLCNEGHKIQWEWGTYVSSDLKCKKCGQTTSSPHPIRWSCPQCKHYFCGTCFYLIIDKICPFNHKYKWYKQDSIEYFSSYTCDNCFEKGKTKEGVFFDSICNITICPKCFCDSCDIPEVLED